MSEDSIKQSEKSSRLIEKAKTIGFIIISWFDHKTNCSITMPCNVTLPEFLKRQFIILNLLSNNNSSAFGVHSLVHRGPFILFN